MDGKMQTEYELLDRNRKFAAVFRVASAISDFETRIASHIDPVHTQVDWEKLAEALLSADELVALDWMRAFWIGTMPADSQVLSQLWRTDCKIKEAIVCALAEWSFANYVLDERYRTPRAA